MKEQKKIHYHDLKQEISNLKHDKFIQIMHI